MDPRLSSFISRNLTMRRKIRQNEIRNTCRILLNSSRRNATNKTYTLRPHGHMLSFFDVYLNPQAGNIVVTQNYIFEWPVTNCGGKKYFYVGTFLECLYYAVKSSFFYLLCQKIGVNSDTIYKVNTKIFLPLPDKLRRQWIKVSKKD